MEQYEQAETHFKQAAYMCPIRFIPLHELMKIYQLKNQHQKATTIARQIIDKPIKIPSGRINQIKKEARKFIHN